MFYAVAAYLMWGLFPAFFPLLKPADPLEILAHRIVWTAVMVTALLVVTGDWRKLKALSLRTWALLAAAGAVITVNWGTYVLAVNSGHVADAALGYFINPLVSIALGIVILRETLPRQQIVAVLVATVAVVWMSIMTGQAPYISLALAFSFGIYGLIKKQVDVSSQVGVAAETLAITPFAVGYIAYLEAQGTSTAFSEGPGHFGLLVASGVITALPLLCFSRGARELNLSTIGMLQYIAPTLQMLWAVLVNHERISTERWIGFALIWLAVAIYLASLMRERRRGPTLRRVGPAPES